MPKIFLYLLEVRIAVVRSSGVDAVLVGDGLPEFGSYLVTALTGLNMDNFPHDDVVVTRCWT